MVTVLSIACAACASDGAATDNAPGNTTSGSGGTVAAPTGTLGNPGFPGTVPSTDPADSASGSCTATFTGDLADSWEEVGDEDSVLYGPWLDPATVDTASDVTFVRDDTLFVLSCGSSGGKAVNITANDPVLQQKATYPLRGTEGDRVVVLANVTGFEVWTVAPGSAESKLVIDAFDDTHIAGTLTVQLVPMSQIPEPEGTLPITTGTTPAPRLAKLVLTFDFPRP